MLLNLNPEKYNTLCSGTCEVSNLTETPCREFIGVSSGRARGWKWIRGHCVRHESLKSGRLVCIPCFVFIASREKEIPRMCGKGLNRQKQAHSETVVRNKPKWISCAPKNQSGRKGGENPTMPWCCVHLETVRVYNTFQARLSGPDQTDRGLVTIFQRGVYLAPAVQTKQDVSSAVWEVIRPMSGTARPPLTLDRLPLERTSRDLCFFFFAICTNACIMSLEQRFLNLFCVCLWSTL